MSRTDRTFVDVDLTPPAAPASITGQALSKTSILLNWLAVTDPSGVTYRVERGDGVTFAQIGTATTTSYTDTVARGSTYTYRVLAVDGAGNLSPYSPTTTVSTAANAAPSWSPGLAAFSVPDSTAIGTVVADIASYASDADNDPLAITMNGTLPAGLGYSSTTKLVTVTGALTQGTSSAVTFTANDGYVGVTSQGVTFSVPVVQQSTARFLIPAVSSARSFSGAGYPLAVGGTGTPVAGDVIELAAGVHGPLAFSGLNGAAGNRIILRSSASGQVTIRRPTALNDHAFVVQFSGCNYFELDGSTTTGQTYGIRITVATDASPTNYDAPAAFLKMSGLCSNYAVRNVDIYGGWQNSSSTSLTDFGIGILTTDAPGVLTSSSPYARTNPANAGRWVENILYDNCRLQRLCSTAMYIGNNSYNDVVPQRFVEISNCYIADCGGSGISLKSAMQGPNSIHHCRIYRTGTATVFPTDKDQRMGANALASVARVYNNWFEDCGGGVKGPTNGNSFGWQSYVQAVPSNGVITGSGYPVIGPLTTTFYNNVVIGDADHGFTCGCDAGQMPPTIYAYNNTFCNNGGSGLLTNTTAGGFVRNNIALGNASTQINSSLAGTNYTTGTVLATFPNSGTKNFHLGSARAVSPGSVIGTDVAADDYEGTVRVIGTADMGAYEF